MKKCILKKSIAMEAEIGLLVPLVSLLTGQVFTACSQEEKQQKPNILFILADDLSYRDLSCYGQTRYSTPNLDALATSGIRFTQAYSAAPECAPARCSLLTGMHTGHSSVRMNSSARGQDHLMDADVTIAEALKQTGYNTAFVGKWGIGLPGTEGLPYLQGFDYCFGYYDQSRAHTFIPEYLWENDRKVEYPGNMGFEMSRRYNYTDNRPQNTYDNKGVLRIDELADPYGYNYSENEILKAALQFLEKNNPGKTGRPFFLYYATQLPHGPVIVDSLGDLVEPREVMQLSREWGAMVTKLDRSVGQLVSFLKQTNNWENTIIFFASDNGYSMCGYTDRGNGPDWPDDPWLQNKGPFTGGKFSVLEGGIRVPFFVSWPGRIKPSVFSEPVWLPDFFPTAVELAGLNPQLYKTDGKSLVPFFNGDEEKFEGHPFLYFSRGREQAVRMGAWKAYRKTPEHEVELYLVEEDTYCLKNLASIYPGVTKRAAAIMEQEHLPHPWYWNPNESPEEFRQKQKLARETGNLMPVFRPNRISRFPWEKENQ